MHALVMPYMLIILAYLYRAFDTSGFSPLHGCLDLPIYAKETKLLSTEGIMNTILNPDLSEKQICSKVPFGVNCNSVFLVDLSKLGEVFISTRIPLLVL